MEKQRFRLVFRGLLLLAIASAILAPAQAQKPEYTVVLLHDRIRPAPFSSRAFAVFDNQVVGTVTPDRRKSLNTRAFLWNLSDNTVQDLHSTLTTPMETSVAQEVSGEYIFGEGVKPGGGLRHSLVWNRETRSQTQRIGMPDSINEESQESPTLLGNLVVLRERAPSSGLRGVLLNTRNLWTSLATGQLPGGWIDVVTSHATVWNLQNHKKVNLGSWLPDDCYESEANDISANHIVGWGRGIGVGAWQGTHAVLWDLERRSATGLHTWLPTTYRNSWAYGIWGRFIVGYAEGIPTPVGQSHSSGANSHAYVWDLDTRTAFDLHTLLSPGHLYSTGKDIAGEMVVGSAAGTATNYRNNAHLWNLSTRTATNLHQGYLAVAGFKDSYATAVDSDGVIVGEGWRNGKMQAWALVPMVRHARESKPLPTVNVGETPLWVWLVSGLITVLVALLALWIWARRRIRAGTNTPQSPERK